MKLIKHGDLVVAIIEKMQEKAYLTAQRGQQDWIPLFVIGSAVPVAEIHSKTLQVRVCVGQQIADQQDVMFGENHQYHC